MFKVPIYPYSYVPLPENYERDMSAIFTPEGSILLTEAINRIGKRKYKEGWTGRETHARALEDFQENDWGIKEVKLVSRAPKPLGQSTPRVEETVPLPIFRVSKIQGTEDVRSLDEAKRIWEIERPKFKTEHEKEQQARERFDDVVQFLRLKLFSGTIEAFILDPSSGKLHSVPGSNWGKGSIKATWEFPNRIKFVMSSHSYGGKPIWVGGSVFLNEQDVSGHVLENDGVSVEGSPPNISREDALKELAKILEGLGTDLKKIPYSQRELAEFLRNRYPCFRMVDEKTIITHHIKKYPDFSFSLGAKPKGHKSFKEVLGSST